MGPRITACALALFLVTPVPAAADTPNQPDPIAQVLIRPDVVMAHQQELAITDAQKHTIEADMEQAQGQFTSLQWQLSAAVEKLTNLLQQSHIDESAALAQLDREQQLEHDIKRAQLTLMIRIKNVLTPQQQAKALAIEHGR
jgi:Spy/CpxP family protein refolding chaperone